MTLKDVDTEDDSAEIEELLAELDEDESNSRYDNLRVFHSSNDSHTKTRLDTSIMHTDESKGPPDEEEKTCDSPHAPHSRTDASKNTMADMPPTSPSKFPHAHHREMRVFAVDMPPSAPPSPPPCGCSCFLLSSHKRVKKQKKSSAEDQRSSKIKAKIQKGKAGDDDDNDDNNEWPRSVFKETGPQQVDAGGLFDVKNTEREFKRASLKEKQLTQEARKLLNIVARS